MMASVNETVRRLRMAACVEKVVSQQRLRLLAFTYPENPFRICTTCRYYYGLTYGGHRLVCAIHPHGPQSDPCPDWECCPKLMS
uniref:Uncharacterized protein n=1 Tax=Cyanothece sp. (strain PCC 7425 / ATCC 29141) TaxID=395961 RepID=B8HU90_CYAP4